MRKATKRTLVAGIAVFGLMLAGCSTVGSSDAGETSEAPDWLEPFQESVNEQYDGMFMDLVDSGPAAQEGKNVWYISCGESITGCALSGQGFREAGEELGWNVTYVDGKFDANEVANGIQRAVAAGADAIGYLVFDCDAVKTSLQMAADAGIPVVTSLSSDCDPSLITNTTLAGELPPNGMKLWSAEKIKWGIVQTNGAMKLINVYQSDLGSERAQFEGLQATLADCPDCEIVENVEITAATFGNIQALVSAALTKHPEANAINITFSGMFPAGVQAAIAQAGRTQDMAIVGGACDGPELSLMQEGWNIACSGYDLAHSGWMTADYINRLLAGESPEDMPNLGIGFQLIDADHNPGGDKWSAPVDFRSAYREVWSGQ